MKSRKHPRLEKQEAKLFPSKDSHEETDDFQKLMIQFGAKPLSENENPSPSKTNFHDPIEFQEDDGWPDNYKKVSLNKKFSGSKQPTKRRARKKEKLSMSFRPERIIDLHGETRESAVSKVEYYMENSKSQGFQNILIITGKGLNSKEAGGGLLQKIIWNWMKKRQSKDWFRFQWAPPFLGGKGAILVFFQ